MANLEHVEVVRRGAEAIKQWRCGNAGRLALRRADLRRADIPRADLSEADLMEADLLEGNLTEADLREADLRGANLAGANLTAAQLAEANLRHADLHGANLQRAVLTGALLEGANLTGADLRGADLRRADLSAADLRQANLHGVDLRSANLDGTQLDGADLTGADRGAAGRADRSLLAAALGMEGPLRSQNCYELLGLALFEQDQQRIREAFEDATARVKPYEVGRHAEEAAHLLEELVTAYRCLTDVSVKQAYDTRLASELGPAASPAPPFRVAGREAGRAGPKPPPPPPPPPVYRPALRGSSPSGAWRGRGGVSPSASADIPPVPSYPRPAPAPACADSEAFPLPAALRRPRSILRQLLRPLRALPAAFGAFFSWSGVPRAGWLDCAVFGPPAAPRGSRLLIQVFVYRPAQAEQAARLAIEADPEATRHGRKTLLVPVPTPTRLTIHLDLPGLTVDDPYQSLMWLGRPEAAQFEVAVPPHLDVPAVIGSVTVLAAEIPLGCIKFTLTIGTPGERRQPNEPEPLGDEARRYRKVFLSYASQDRDEVLKRAQILRSLRVGFFQDVLCLEAGDEWAKVLFEHIEACDLFLLFWSQAAKDSEWVMKEIRYARERRQRDPRRLPDIRPILIPPPVDPPAELADLQFGDYLHFLMRHSAP